MTGPAWAAAAYDALPLPHEAWGAGVAERLGEVAGPDGGAPVVLDAGCGTGRDAERLLDAHPSWQVVGLDADQAMLDRAGDRLSAHGGRVRLVRADLGAALPTDRLAAAGAPVDAVTSVAAFHWVADTAVLAANLAALVRPGGRLVAECGGAGQLAAVDAVLVGLGAHPHTQDTTFRTPDAWGAALDAAGFDVERVALRPHPVTIEDLDVLARFLETIVLRMHVAALPPGQRAPFARAVAERLPRATMDYVRLEVEATRR